MSVVKSKRGEGQLVVITKASELAAYSIKICSNEAHFPKRYRWCITNKIVDAAMEISNNAVMANSVFVKDESDYKLRKQYQTKALSSTYALLNMMDMAYRTFGIETGRIEHWTRLTVEVQTMLRNWRKADIERYKSFSN